MKTFLIGLSSLLLLGSIVAQDEPVRSPDAPTRLKELQAERDQVIATWQAQRAEAVKAAAKAAEEAKRDGKPIPAISMSPDFSALGQKYLAAAKEFPASAPTFLVPALSMRLPAPQLREVLDTILDHHLDSSDLAPMGGMMPFLGRMVSEEYAQQAFAKIDQHGKNTALLAWVAFARGEKTLRSADPTSQPYVDTKALVAAAIEKAGDTNLKQRFDSIVNEKEKFGIGIAAPDISGVDLDGVAFKLSDYRGRVIFVDFWGDW